MPAGFVKWAKKQLTPKHDWRSELSHAFRSAITVTNDRLDYTYTRMSRRASVMQDVILPGMWSPRPNVAIVADTSGSVSDTQLDMAVAEMEGILQGLVGSCSVHVIACDAAVHSSVRVMKADDVVLAGRGGTDMRVGLAHAEQLEPKPDVLVVITDFETSWPATRPDMEEIILVDVGNSDDRYKTSAKWEHTYIKIPPDFE